MVRTIFLLGLCAAVCTAQQSWPSLKNMQSLYFPKDELPRQGFTKAEIAAIREATAPNFAECSRNGEWPDLMKLAVRRVKLQDSGATTLAVSGGSNPCFCGGNGNCDFWLLRKNNAGFKPVLATTVDLFYVDRAVSHGFYDLIIYGNLWAGGGGLTRFRFDGAKYVPYKCADIASEDRSTGKRFDPPRLTPGSCALQ